MRKFKTWRDPYDRGFSTTRLKEIEIEEGLTVLVGCNGAGKSTLLKNIEDTLKQEKIPCFHYDNRSNDIKYKHQFDFEYFSTSLASSEGENISINLNYVVKELRNFIDSGSTAEDDEVSRLAQIFGHDLEQPTESNQRWLLLDAVDSGYSIDRIIELKKFFHFLIADCNKKNISLYIIVSANEFELVDQSRCFDVIGGKYITFKDYADFKKFILHSRDLKQRREERAASSQQKES